MFFKLCLVILTVLLLRLYVVTTSSIPEIKSHHTHHTFHFSMILKNETKYSSLYMYKIILPCTSKELTMYVKIYNVLYNKFIS